MRIVAERNVFATATVVGIDPFTQKEEILLALSPSPETVREQAIRPISEAMALLTVIDLEMVPSALFSSVIVKKSTPVFL